MFLSHVLPYPTSHRQGGEPHRLLSMSCHTDSALVCIFGSPEASEVTQNPRNVRFDDPRSHVEKSLVAVGA